MATGRGVGPGTYDRSLRWETDGAASAFVSGSARGGIDSSFSYPSPGDYSPTLSWHSDIGCTAAFRSKSIRKMSQAAWGTPGPGAYHATAVAPSHLAQRGIKRPPPRTTWEWTRVATTPSIPSHSLSIEGEQALVVVVPVRCIKRCSAVDVGAVMVTAPVLIVAVVPDFEQVLAEVAHPPGGPAMTAAANARRFPAPNA